MLKLLQTENIGPTERLSLEFSDRVNILTGDNGLGKSFVLDVAWWAMTRVWPQELNLLVSAGRQAYPPFGQGGKIHVELSDTSRERVSFDSSFDRKALSWSVPRGIHLQQGLVIYAMLDGSFAVWDTARNIPNAERATSSGVPPAFVYSPTEVWEGKFEADGAKSCNGIIEDLAYWFIEQGEPYRQLKDAIELLSPQGESLTLGGITRLGDSRRYACIKMPYSHNKDIPIPLLSSAIKRILSIAYFLVWAWQEHLLASREDSGDSAPSIAILIDEPEAHLHPRWQLNILKMLQKAVSSLTACSNIQYFVSTHSPLVMASCEDFFSDALDTWIDINLRDGKVLAQKMPFSKKGDATKWLLSDAFDMLSTRSENSQAVLSAAESLMCSPSPDVESIRQMQHRLEDVLPSRDSFWLRWNVYLAKKKIPAES